MSLREGSGPAKQVNGKTSRVHLDNIRDLVEKRFGFWVKDCWYDKLEAEIQARMEALGFAGLSDYVRELSVSSRGGELQELMDRLVIGETSFHRNPDQFDVLRNEVFPALAESRANGRIRFASLGCSTGEEPYSLAIAAAEALAPADFERLEIVGVDISNDALRRARDGCYSTFQLREYDDGQRERWFEKIGDLWRVQEPARSKVRFIRANITEPLPMTGLDVVFCRNVLIYFQKPAVARFMQYAHDALNPEGYLFLGHAETANEYGQLFRTVYAERTFYFRRELSSAPARPLSVSEALRDLVPVQELSLPISDSKSNELA